MLSATNFVLQRAAAILDAANDRLTSYRLVLYFLIILVGWTMIGSLAGQIAYEWYDILLSAVWLSGLCWAVNKLIGRLLDIPTNKESGLISGLILALIMTPAVTGHDYLILAAAAIAAMASKYILTFRRSHIFNPAAFGAFIAGALFHGYASWWVGTKFTVPLMIIGGLLILRKTKRFSLFLVFCAIYELILIWQLPAGSSTDAISHLFWLGAIDTSLLFFSIIMLTEPLTSPAALNPTLIYAAIVGVFYSYNRLHVSPEEALLIGNFLTFLIAPNRRYKLDFVRKIKDAEGIYSYVFSMPKNFTFKAGQYMEWTLNQVDGDSRGNRRYLTIASSPTEPEVMITIRRPPNASAFKRRLESLKPGEPIFASYLSGSFTLPTDKDEKLAFLAGGVGITPFRSMMKYLLDNKEGRDMAILYAVNQADELAFRKLFKQAEAIGLKNFYTTGRIDKKAIASALPDHDERTFYISGPYAFVQAMERVLNELGVSPTRIITDYFPGYGT